jgi:Ca2+/H+ antiporter
MSKAEDVILACLALIRGTSREMRACIAGRILLSLIHHVKGGVSCGQGNRYGLQKLESERKKAMMADVLLQH